MDLDQLWTHPPQVFLDPSISGLYSVLADAVRERLDERGADIIEHMLCERVTFMYCLAGETGVITRDGVRPIAELAGGVHELLVPVARGSEWRKVPVESFGEQPLMKVTLSRSGTEKVIHATPEHRWLAKRRLTADHRGDFETTTARLEPGTRLRSTPITRHVVTLSAPGVAHGFVFGDGTLAAPGQGAVAQFCGPKDEAMLKYFPGMVVREPRPGEKRIHGLPRFFKELPPLDEAPAYLYGWLAGYFAADGTVSGTSAVLTCADREVLEFVQTLCTRIGIVTYPIGVHKRNAGSYKPDGGDYFYLNFRSADLPPEFFLLPSHRERWERTKRGSGISHDIWRVVSVEPTDRVEEVYCAVVEGEAAFTLDGFIATGNCHIRDKDARAGTTTGWAHDRVRRETIKDWSALTENLQRRWLKEDLADRDDQTKRKFAAALRSALLDIDPSIAGQLRDNLAAELAHVGL